MLNSFRTKLRPVVERLKPFKGILLFVFLFLSFELIWKIIVRPVDDGEQLIVLGFNLTHLIYPICKLDANIVYRIIHDMLGYTDFNIDDLLIYFDNALPMKIIWSCTSIKQYLLFIFIMVFYYGPWKKKVVFIPVSLLLLSFVNIVRLVVSALLLRGGFPDWFITVNEVLNGKRWDGMNVTYWEFYRDWYRFFHDGFFKWIYYDGIMFLLWLYWHEKINLPYQRKKIAKEIK